MRRQDELTRRETVRYARYMVGLAVVAAVAGVLVLPGALRPAELPPRPPLALTLEATDRRYQERYAELTARTDKASRLEAAQLLALWGNDTNRQLEKGREAERLARDLVRDFPDEPVAWSALGYALEIQGRLSDARVAYLRGRELAPESAQVNWHVAHVDSLSGDDSRAREMLGVTLRLDPRHAQALTLQGYYDIQSGSVDTAVARFELAVTSAPNARIRAEALLNLSAAHLLRAETAQALDAGKRATEADPSYSGGWLGYARAVLAARDDRAEAKRAVAQALALYPSHSHAYIVLSQVAGLDGAHVLQADHLRRAREVLTEDNTVLGAAKKRLDPILYAEEAKAAARAGDAARAVAVIESGLTRYPVTLAAIVLSEARSGSAFNALKADPAFAALLKRLGG